MGGALSHAELHSELPRLQEYEGELHKESESIKAWNQRYAQLKDRVLSYWDSREQMQSGQPPRARISLENALVTVVDGDADPEHEDCFLLETPEEQKRVAAQRGQTRMYFQAPTRFIRDQWVHYLRLASREPWQDTTPGCSLCDLPFDLMNRPHHCRRCGQTVCQQCSRHQQAMLDFGYPEPVRVCDTCRGHFGPLPPESVRRANAEQRREARDKAARAQRIAEVKSRKAISEMTAEERKSRLRDQFIR